MTENDTHDDHEPRAWWRRPYEDIALAMTLLTRIPMPGFAVPKDAPLARAVWAFPIAGTIVGAIGAVGFELATILRLNSTIAVLIALAAMVMASGALHEDGLADFCDGLGGGNDPQERLEIMRDSRIGTYGTLALIFVLLLQTALFSYLPKIPMLPHALPMAPWPMWTIFIAVATIARAAMFLPMSALSPARSSGLGTSVAPPPVFGLALGTLIATGLAIALLGLKPALYAITGAFVMSAVVTLLAHRYIKGQTGDVLGATACTSTIGALVGLNSLGAHL